VATDPWHLWGNTQSYVVAGQVLGALPSPNNSQTLAKVGYGRPDSWRFMLSAVIESGGSDTAVGEQAIVEVVFALIIGVGRSAIKLPEFVALQWDWSGGLSVFRHQALYVTQAPSVPAIGGAPGASPFIDLIMAESCSVQASVSYFTDVAAPAPIHVDVSAQLAPNVHIRPDWFQIGAPPAVQFPGKEVGGK
jgi:hypothetical protein